MLTLPSFYAPEKPIHINFPETTRGTSPSAILTEFGLVVYPNFIKLPVYIVHRNPYVPGAIIWI